VRGIIFADINGEGAKDAASEARKVASDPDFKAIGVQVDVTNASSVQNLVDTAVNEFGTIEYLVNSAGVDVAQYIPFTETTEEDYDRVFAVNTKGTFLVTKAVAKVIQKQEIRTVKTKRYGERSIGRGAIVNVASGLSLIGIGLKVPYVASKHAVLGITRTASLDLNPYGIRVNMVAPSWVKTPMFEEETRRVPPVSDLVKKLIPAGRPADPDEVANAVAYLCSEAASYVSGECESKP
jgi:NAD(P)-dependent dehydrogenase (short-subunit alcohol dehydrogenase family)